MGSMSLDRGQCRHGEHAFESAHSDSGRNNVIMRGRTNTTYFKLGPTWPQHGPPETPIMPCSIACLGQESSK